MTRRDPLERFREADPARRTDPARPSDPAAQTIFQRITTSDDRSTTSRSRRRRRWIPLLVGAVFLMGAASYILFRPVTEPLTVGCYRAAAIDADRVVLPATSDASATDICSSAWAPGGEFAADSAGGVPPLEACVLDTGTLGVFPSTGTGNVCEQLGLADPDPGSTDDNQAVVELQDALIPQFLDTCLDLTQATAVVESELASRNLDQWQLATNQPFSAERPCASLAIDPVTMTIELIPISP